MMILILLYIYMLFIINTMLGFILKNYYFYKSRPMWITLWESEDAPVMYPTYPCIDDAPNPGRESDIIFVGELSSLYMWTGGRYIKLNSKYGSQFTKPKKEPTMILLSELGIFMEMSLWKTL